MEKKPILRLGLDIGTTSVGWALTENFEIPEDLKLEEAEEFEPSRLLIKDGKFAAGVRIIPTTADVLKEFNKGENVSKCKDRTQKRGARRLLQRYRARRERLLTVLRALSWIPADFPVLYGREYTEKLRKYAREGKKYPDCVLNDLMRQKGWQVNPKQTVGTGNFAKTLLTPARVHERFAQMGKEFDIQTISEDGKVILPLDWLVFYLRHLATREQLSPEELALVLYHLNQKRGFKSSKKGNEEENKTSKDSEKNKENNGKPTEEAKEFKNYFVKSVEKTDKKYKGSDVYSVVLSESSESELEFAFTINKAPDKEHKDLAHFQANLHQSMQVSLQKSKGSFKCELPKSQKTVTEEWAVIRKIVPLGKKN
jgi:CRISPR/Cas system Type II protein with McrA/HNH and RuvC-like nuclease domain